MPATNVRAKERILFLFLKFELEKSKSSSGYKENWHEE